MKPSGSGCAVDKGLMPTPALNGEFRRVGSLMPLVAMIGRDGRTGLGLHV